jgi:SagB-type dehydrogenase family enzyme
MTGGMPLMQALKLRHSTREFADRPLPPQVLSDLLWAGFGVNRSASGGRTAPSAHDWQEIDLYVLTAMGTYRYDAKRNTLQPVTGKDLRRYAGKQGFVAQAPLNLVYVANYGRMKGATEHDRRLYSAVAAGTIVQNVYLYCASAGLNTVVRGWVDRTALARVLGLKANQHIVVAQTVGYPK